MVSSDPRNAQPTLVSVAVSSYNRPEGVAALLAALESQTLPRDRFEVVVVDNGSTPEAGRIVKQAVERSPLTVELVQLETNQGACGGRNHAWRRARSPVVAFTDDDCHPAPRWLEEGLRMLEGHPAVLVGATEPHPDQVHLLDPLARTMRVRDTRVAPTCNVFYFRQDLEAVDGFDERYGAMGGEDTDLAWRVHGALGRPLRFASEALVYHDVRPRTLRQAARETRRWAGIPLVAARHPEMARLAWPRGPFLYPAQPLALVAAAGLVASLVFPPSLVLILPWTSRRILRGKPSRRWIHRLRYAPALFLLELLEIWVLLRASIRYRSVAPWRAGFV